MNDLNRILLAGRLGANPVMRSTKNGTPVTQFSLATSRRLGDGALAPTDGGDPSPREETQWHKIVVWGKQAEICAKYLEKGRKVFLEGSVRTRKYSAQDGAPRLSFEVHADRVNFLDSPRRPHTEEAEIVAAEAEASASLEEAAA
jgi:single-strand DNA-binding protein